MLLKLIHQSVNSIWQDYDTKKTGYLTLEESRDFIRDSFGSSKPQGCSEEDIVELFNRIDIDGEGKINKGEMALFILALTKF